MITYKVQVDIQHYSVSILFSLDPEDVYIYKHKYM